MKISSTILVLVIISCFKLQGQTEIKKSEKMQILIHVTSGPENPTRAALAFLIAKTAIEEGHGVTLFLLKM